MSEEKIENCERSNIEERFFKRRDELIEKLGTLDKNVVANFCMSTINKIDDTGRFSDSWHNSWNKDGDFTDTWGKGTLPI
ncbi:hypothetical protein QUF88_05575 [Bacillus sp. DX1.1]|uniref:hypothetical protein n=1 Tax=unclassified Bacillus (in: firmicutes) TaxID=185979 RepID=UPI002570EA32|nr:MULTISPECIES: hypothetical protein [unclassified Bacillus (in: firmicutes)]MDM5153339.1 hypothetical protein [Bacillus sp. DX1.1]WJE82297.1 hypothetical protein QRE67_03095 [Bacillus sp. DX3.1]